MKKKSNVYFAFLVLLCNSMVVMSQDLTGIKLLNSVDRLPFRHDLTTKVMYEGSIDKKGDNADWDWWLYQDKMGEWVLFDVDDLAVSIIFVVHHDLKVSGSTSTASILTVVKCLHLRSEHSEFSEKFPFIEP